jgi:Tol biopolymer transport system component
LSAAVGVFAQTSGSARSRWTTDDLVMAEQASGFQISPDNRWVVWVRSTPNRREDKLVTDLVLTSLSDGKEVQLTRDGSADSPKWSPDGQSIAFTTSRKSADLSPDAAGEQLWLISPFGGEARRISGLTRSVSDYA